MLYYNNAYSYSKTPSKCILLCLRSIVIAILVLLRCGRPPVVQAAVGANPQASPINHESVGQGGLFILRGNTRPEAMAKNDRGRVSDGFPLPHLMLLLQRGQGQEQALEQFIKDIHDPVSSRFHHWLTAAEFGQEYGLPQADVARVTQWLESQGFTVNLVYPNRMLIDFSGTAGQIGRAFHTEIHNLRVNGEAHIANMSDPQIPATLAATVAGVVSLHDFMPSSLVEPRSEFAETNGANPLVPADLWTIYNFSPAFASGISGQGQTVVVLASTDLYSLDDWDDFRSSLGLSSAFPQGAIVQVHPPSNPVNNCADPGVNGNDMEISIDAEWASAAAPSATIEVASCASGTMFGGFFALQNLLNGTDPPPAVVSLSVGAPETAMGAAFNAFISSLYQQAVTEGVSVLVAAGDEGAADADSGENYARSGITVNGLASTPYNVAVGGTDFADNYTGSTEAYWSSSNLSNYATALSYVPEIPWNDSCASVLRADYMKELPPYGANGLCDVFQTLVAGSGGPSGCATGSSDSTGPSSINILPINGTCVGYPKPDWQSALVGNPSDGVRDLPDVSLFASNGAWGHSLLYCLSDPLFGYDCSASPTTWPGTGGTSFTAPILAGIQALVNQASGTRWGNPNPTYYALARQEYGSGGSSSCNAALGNQVASNCIFYDINQIPLLYGGTGKGGDIDVPCSGMNCYQPSGTYGVLSTAPQALTTAYITNIGSGYTGAPSCSISGGGGVGATCSASLTVVVSSLTLTNGGSGYTSAPTCTLTGGGGTGATCFVYGTSLPNNAASGLNLVTPGSGFTSAPTCALSGGGGAGAACTATVAPGVVVSLTAPGSGYITLPRCLLSGGGGTGGTCAVQAVNTSSAYEPAYIAGTGWDFATGIGTVNVANLVAGFNSMSSTPVAGVSPGSVTFSGQMVGTTSAAQAITLSNTGTAALVISSIATSTNFGQTNNCGSSVEASGSCTINVTFTPTAGGSVTGTLTINDNSGRVTASKQTVNLNAVGQDFSMGMASGSSSSASYTLSVSGLGGLSQSVAFNCTGAPSEATCTVSPNPLSPGNSATNVTVSVTTTAPSGMAPRSFPAPLLPLRKFLPLSAAPLVVLTWLFMAWGSSRPRWLPRLLPLAVGVFFALGIAACGGGGGSGSPGPNNPGTPAGNYTLTVTGTVGSGGSAVSHSTTLTLTVS